MSQAIKTGPVEPSGASVSRLGEARREAPQTPPPQSQPPAAEAATETAAPPARKGRGWLRPVLFLALPAALVAGGYYYVTGGAVISTENAYVGADIVNVSTDVAGTVAEVAVHENERVTKGQLLYRLRDSDLRIALDGARAQLENVRNQVLTLGANYRQMQAQVTQAEADVPFFQAVFKRQQDLSASAAASRAAYDQAKHDLDAAEEKVRVARAAAEAVLAQLGGDADRPVEQNAQYLQAKSAVDRAEKDFADAVVRAPFDGIVTNVDRIQVGTYLQASQQAFNLVAENSAWIEANPKETELTYVHPGQKVGITVDAYPGVAWTGTVESISPASGSSFALLPAQNTSGNWVKVVQRIPMRVRIEDQDGKPPLRVGMSAVVDIDTGHPRGLPEFVTRILGDKAYAGDHG
jgi:membrane fusion protein (multidrug efflux system)